MALKARKNPDGSISYKDDKNPSIAFTVKGGVVVDGVAAAPSDWKTQITTAIPVEAKTVKATPAVTKDLTEDQLYKAITEKGRITPTGEVSDNPFPSIQEWKDHLTKAGISDPRLNTEETQSQIYDKADPYWRAYMWGTYGDTAKGASGDKFERWKPLKGESQDAYRKRMEVSGYTVDKIKAETDALKPKFADKKSGVREAFLSTKIPTIPEVKPEVPVVAEEKKLPGYVPPYEGQRRDAPYWLQDVINMGAATANRLSLKKYMPWAPKVEPHVPRPVLYDPTRALAANAEEMKIGTEGAGMFSGPQAFNSRFSQIQGQGAKNAANILSQYHTMNVNEINKFEQIKSGIYNQADAFNANQAQKLYDQTTIANQQFDNSKRKAFDEMRGAAVNAITNRAQAQTMNYMYPHYQIDPSRGGFTYGYRGADMVPGSPTDENSIFKKIEDAKTNYGVDEETARNVLGYGSSTKRGTGRSAEGDDFLNQYSQIQHKDGGASEEVKWLRKYNKFPSVLGS